MSKGDGTHASHRQTRRAWWLLAIAIALLNAGNLLLEAIYSGRDLSLEMFFEPGLFAALALLGISFGFYSRALAVLPLAVAYPVMVGITLLVVGVSGFLWLNANLDSVQVTGMVVVFAGVTLISRKSKRSTEEVTK